jgi:hypothetical protein
MNHLENHPHAFFDADGKVIQVALFSGHNHALLDQVKEEFGYHSHRCCCDNGLAYIGGDFYNGKFYTAQPYPEWVRDESVGKWVAPEGWVEPSGDNISE